MSSRSQRLLFMFTEDWAFASLFLDRAIAAKNAGYEVAVHVRCSEHRAVIEQAGLQVISHNISRSGLNPFRELVSVLQLIKVLRSFRPDVIHLIALKPIVLGSLASIFYPKAKGKNHNILFFPLRHEMQCCCTLTRVHTAPRCAPMVYSKRRNERSLNRLPTNPRAYNIQRLRSPSVHDGLPVTAD